MQPKFATLTLAFIAAMAGFARAQSDEWWSISSAEFCKNYGSQAVSDDMKQRENFAWMAFARVNQLTKLGGQIVPRWLGDQFRRQRRRTERVGLPDDPERAQWPG